MATGISTKKHAGTVDKCAACQEILADAYDSKPSKPQSILPTDPKERKAIPVYSGVLKYFPDAIAYIAKVSKAGNDQHNGEGSPLHWSRGKSDDHHDTAARHLLESGTIDSDGLRHSGKLAWRALAILQLEIEADKNKE